MKEELKRIDNVLVNYDNLNKKLDKYLKVLENNNEMYSQLKDEYKKQEGVCESCGTTKNVSYVIDPYDKEINDIERWCYLCPECYKEHLDDI